MRCPQCNSQLDIEISQDHKDSSLLRTSLRVNQRDKASDLVDALHRYWRWKAEGELPYGSSFGADEKRQYYYDGYHNSVRYIPEEDLYSFNIQTYDSPEYDVWWSGKFKYDTGKIVIVEDSSKRC